MSNKPILIQCVPNFSEGRDKTILLKIANAISNEPVRLVNWSADIDHNRSVYTFVGPPDGVRSAALAAAMEAVSLIDLTQHRGVHPRIGAIDVLPFVPLANATLENCADIANRIGHELANRLGIPVFFYDFASPNRTSLPTIRKAAFTKLPPDIGPSSPHPTAGAIAIGAREPLIAFNVNLLEGTLAIAKRIASEVRSAFPGEVRALGLELMSRKVYQVSMNVVKVEKVSLSGLVTFINDRHPVLESELIGAMPGMAAFETVRSSLRLTSLTPEQVLLESWPKLV